MRRPDAQAPVAATTGASANQSAPATQPSAGAQPALLTQVAPATQTAASFQTAPAPSAQPGMNQTAPLSQTAPVQTPSAQQQGAAGSGSAAGGTGAPGTSLPASGTSAQSPSASMTPGVGAAASLSLTDALTLGRSNQTGFATALANSRIAELDRSIARSALLPSVVYHNQYLFTTSAGPATITSTLTPQTQGSSSPVFIANNSVHEYVSQAVVSETIGLPQFTAVSRAAANAAVASAELEIARRGLVAALVGRAEVEAAARRSNPELASATAALRASRLDVTAARAAYLPDLALNYTYGIDATHFAVHNPDRSNNLGYAASATIDLPVWDWLATEHRIRQSVIRRELAQTTLSVTQRRLVADLEENYQEAQVASDQLASLAQSAATAAESLRLTRLRYTAGEATVLEVVDAQSSLLAAELAREDGTVRYQAALAALQLLTGTL